MDKLTLLWQTTGLSAITVGQTAMIIVGGILLFLAIAKKFEPLLLLPIGFGAILANIPLAGFTQAGRTLLRLQSRY